MKLKVCGMKYEHNIRQIAALKPDMMGFIFFASSPRYVENINLKSFPADIKKVGVFINSNIAEINKCTQKHNLNFIQLHGNETPEFCKELGDVLSEEVALIKAFSVDKNFDFSITISYKPYTDYFLFDTKGKNYGGNGVAFDWDVLKQYDNELPFFLSGGIDIEHIEIIKNMKNMNIYAIDINSRFEDALAEKNISKVKYFKQKLLPENMEPKTDE